MRGLNVLCIYRTCSGSDDDDDGVGGMDGAIFVLYYTLIHESYINKITSICLLYGVLFAVLQSLL